jgi:thiamine-monophosphate kinase
MTGELRLVRDLVARFGSGTGDEVWLGDDTAVVRPPRERLLLAIDPVVAGVHFDEGVPAGDVGWNALARNFSDLAAMGGRPLHALVSLVVPTPSPWPIEAVVTGLAEAADAFGCRIVGGDTSSGPALVVTVAVTGTVDGGAVLRSGAGVGDLIFLSGPLGASTGRIQPRLAAGAAARLGGATAMIDVSDGLLADLGHVSRASGVRIDVRSGALEIPARLHDIGRALGVEPLHWLLTGGEDHALAATFPGPPPEGWTEIGVVTDGEPDVLVDGRPYEGGPAGWDHFVR